jgi:HEAT repeat protein
MRVSTELVLEAVVDIDAKAAIALDDSQRRGARNDAIKALGRSGDAAAVGPLTLALQDRKFAVISATAMGVLGCREAVPALSEALAGADDKVARFAAAGALGKIGDPAAAEALRNAARSDRDSSVRSSATKALKKLERAAAAAVALEQPIDDEVRQLAAEGKERRAFNVPFIVGGLAIAGVMSYWVGGSESLGTTLPMLVVVAIVVIGINLVQGWQKNR